MANEFRSGLPKLCYIREEMQVECAAILTAQPETAAASETLEQIYQRVFRQLRPRTPLPAIRVQFRRYANANAQIQLELGTLRIRLADTLESAPGPVMEALAEILLAKLFRRPVPADSNERYRRYLNRRDIRRSLDLVRQIRGRKRVEGPQGVRYDLYEIFEELNFRYFHGLMARPILGWSPYASRTLLGHYDPSHNAIVLSRILDRADTPKLAVEYVLFHEMLHLRYPAEHRGARRCVHTRDFKDAERQFERLAEAKLMLRGL
jgi:hypothetical protein